MTRTGLPLFAVSLLVLTVGLCDAAAPRYRFGAEGTFESGDYGSGSNTRTVTLPFSIARLFESGELKLTVPYESLTSNGQVTLVNGVPANIGGPVNPGQGQGRQRRAKASPSTSTVSGEQTNSGLGDVLFNAEYYLLDENGWIPFLSVESQIKFPTADKDKGLGTGKFDVGAGLGASTHVTQKYLLSATYFYSIIGSPTGAHLPNKWEYDLAVGYSITPESDFKLHYHVARSLLADLPDPKELILDMERPLHPRIGFYALIKAGLNESAPDYGLAAGFNVKTAMP